LLTWLAAGLLLVALYATAMHAPLFESLAPRRIERAAPRGSGPHLVVLLSIDGLAPRVIAHSDTPVLDRLAREGRVAEHARTVMPSITMAAHTTMLTGLDPVQHGVTFNRYQPWSTIHVPTLFDRCAEEGLRCGLFAGKTKFAHFAQDAPGAARYQWQPNAQAVLRSAAEWAIEADPDWLFVHLAEVDLTGHEHGWDGPAQRAVVAEIDGLVGSFLERLARDAPRPVALLLTSDHGGHGTRHGTDLPEDMQIPWLLWGSGVSAGSFPEATALDTAPSVLALLGLDAPETWTGRSRVEEPAGGAR
jgi:predicted AlkP superfamily pyrophosphatase or phosphodiesterase